MLKIFSDILSLNNNLHRLNGIAVIPVINISPLNFEIKIYGNLRRPNISLAGLTPSQHPPEIQSILNANWSDLHI